jgi:acetoin utilization deacetylase AcuC-like enzyme
MRRRLYYCDHHRFPLPDGHKFPVEKYRLLRERLSVDGAWDLQPAPRASPEDVELAHDPAYVRAFLTGSIDTQSMRRIGFPWSRALVERTLASVGGTLAASRDALESGFGGTLAGGTHHAFRDHGSGFCVFNDLAVAILALRRDGLARRAAVIDLDVHQGDGTALIFEDDSDVFTLSIHGSENFPFRKQRSRLDIELPDATGDVVYLDTLDGALRHVFDFLPEIVWYQAGVDGLAGDRLGRLSLSPGGLWVRDMWVFDGCFRRGIPVVVTLGGGYSDPIEHTVAAHYGTFRAAASAATTCCP